MWLTVKHFYPFLFVVTAFIQQINTICFEVTGGLYIKKLVREVNLKLWIIPCIADDRKANCKIKISRLKPRSSYLLIVGFHSEKSLHEKQPVVLYFNNNTHFLRLDIYIVYKWVVMCVRAWVFDFAKWIVI